MSRSAALPRFFAAPLYLALAALLFCGAAWAEEKKSAEDKLRDEIKAQSEDEKIFNEHVKGVVRLADDEAGKPYPKVCGSLTGSTGHYLLVALDETMRKSLLAYNNTEVGIMGKVLAKEAGKHLIVSEIVVATNPGRDRRKRGGL